MQDLRGILPLFWTPRWPSHQVSENQELSFQRFMLLAKQSLGNCYKMTNSINLRYLKMTNEALCSERLCRYVIRRLSRSSMSHVTLNNRRFAAIFHGKLRNSTAAVQSSLMEVKRTHVWYFISPFFNLISHNVYYPQHYSTGVFTEECLLLDARFWYMLWAYFLFKILALTVKSKLSLRSYL